MFRLGSQPQGSSFCDRRILGTPEPEVLWSQVFWAGAAQLECVRLTPLFFFPQDKNAPVPCAGRLHSQGLGYLKVGVGSLLGEHGVFRVKRQMHVAWPH